MYGNSFESDVAVAADWDAGWYGNAGCTDVFGYGSGVGGSDYSCEGSLTTIAGAGCDHGA